MFDDLVVHVMCGVATGPIEVRLENAEILISLPGATVVDVEEITKIDDPVSALALIAAYAPAPTEVIDDPKIFPLELIQYPPPEGDWYVAAPEPFAVRT